MVPPTIGAVLFDIDGTLYDFEHDTAHAFRNAADWARTENPQLALELPETNFRRAQVLTSQNLGASGAGPWEWRVHMFSQLLQTEGIVDQQLAEGMARQYGYWRGREARLFPGVLRTLRKLRSAKVPLGVITNGNSDLEQAGLGGYFRFVLRAWDLHLEKPDPRIFTHAIELLGVAADQILFVGDSPHTDIVGAKAVGMRGAWVNRLGARLPLGVPVPDYVIAEVDELLLILGLERRRTSAPEQRS